MMDAQRRKHRLDKMSIEAQREIAEGSADKGADICRKLIREWSDVQGPEGERVLVWRGFLGKALTEARRYNQAEEVLSDLLVDRERLLGPDDPSVLVTRGNLARVIALGGRPREAIFHAERLLADRLRLLGPDHPNTLDSVGHIAHFHFIDGEYAIAAEMYEELLERRIQVLGDDHPDVFQTEHNLVACRAKLGNPDDIEDNRELAMVLQEELGFDHLDTLNAFSLLADALLRVGETQEALAIGQSVLDAYSRLLGDRDPKTLSCRRLIQRSLLGLDRLDDAIDVTLRIVELDQESGRGMSLVSINPIVALFDAIISRAEFFGLRLPKEQTAAVLSLCDHLESVDPQKELATEYRDLAGNVRAAIR
jgi:tetratricopeptide (TPR) repeat protein